MSTPFWFYSISPDAEAYPRPLTLTDKTFVFLSQEFPDRPFTVRQAIRAYAAKRELYNLPPATENALYRRIAYMYQLGLVTRRLGDSSVEPEQRSGQDRRISSHPLHEVSPEELEKMLGG